MPTLSAQTEAKLQAYLALLQKWQPSINLISPATLPDAWNRHFLDSLQLVDLLPPQTKTIYDLGSGAGFPGLLLAMAMPDIDVTLIESDAKKCAFLSTVSRETQTSVTVRNERIEVAAQAFPAPDVITARALKGLEELLTLIHPWAKSAPNLVAIFPKGARCEEEIAQAKAKGWVFHVEQIQSQTDKDGRILIVKNIAKAV